MRRDVAIGIGDDGAVTQVPEKQLLVTTTDTLVEGTHFLPNTDAAAIAHKAIAVNLSDLAAMGAEPAWISLSLSIPQADQAWLAAFADKIHQLSQYYGFQLIGGDTVQGPLAVTITAQGFVPTGSVLRRDGAALNDLVYVTGTLGDAGLGLDLLQDKLAINNKTDFDFLTKRHWFPTPRVLAGTTLRRLASACIDLSDGLIRDAQQIADASSVGMLIHLEKLPLSPALGNNIECLEQALSYATGSGDDYELLFTVSEDNRVTVETALQSYDIPFTCIGQVTGASGKIDLSLDEHKFAVSQLNRQGFEHFAS